MKYSNLDYRRDGYGSAEEGQGCFKKDNKSKDPTEKVKKNKYWY